MRIEKTWGKHMKRLLAVGLAVLMAACTPRPSGDVIENQVVERLTRGDLGLIYSVENFRKTNGLPRDDNTYVAEVAYELRFKTGVQGAAEILQRGSGSIFSAGAGAARLAMKYGDFQKGDVLAREEQVRFVRTEKGWRIDEETP